MRRVERKLDDDEPRIGGPGEVVDVVLDVAVRGPVALRCFRDALAGRSDDEAGRHGHRDVEAAVVGVELGVGVERVAVPSAGGPAPQPGGLVNPDLREPLADEEVVAHVARPREDLRKLGVEGDVERDFAVGRDGRGQRHEENRLVRRVVAVRLDESGAGLQVGAVGGLDGGHVDPAPVARLVARLVPAELASGLAHERRPVVLERVQVEMEAQLRNRVAGGVAPDEVFLAVQRLRLRFERNLDRVLDDPGSDRRRRPEGRGDQQEQNYPTDQRHLPTRDTQAIPEMFPEAPQYSPPKPEQSIQSGPHADRFRDRGDRIRGRPRRPRARRRRLDRPPPRPRPRSREIGSARGAAGRSRRRETSPRRAWPNAPLSGADAIVHLAGLTKARSLEEYREVNARGTERLVAAGRRSAPKALFVLVSSQAAAGPAVGGRALGETDPPRPISWYGLSKREGEQAVESGWPGPWHVIRPGVVYGPFDRRAPPVLPDGRARPGSRSGAGDAHPARRHRARQPRDREGGRAAGPRRPAFLPLRSGAGHDRRARHRRSPPGRAAARGSFRCRTSSSAASDSSSRRREALTGRSRPFNADKARELLAGDWLCDGKPLAAALGLPAPVALSEGLRTAWEWYRSAGWLGRPGVRL